MIGASYYSAPHLLNLEVPKREEMHRRSVPMRVAPPTAQLGEYVVAVSPRIAQTGEARGIVQRLVAAHQVLDKVLTRAPGKCMPIQLQRKQVPGTPRFLESDDSPLPNSLACHIARRSHSASNSRVAPLKILVNAKPDPACRCS